MEDWDVAHEADQRGDVEEFKRALCKMLADPNYDYHYTLELFEDTFPIDWEDRKRRELILYRWASKYIIEESTPGKIDQLIKFRILADCMFEAKKENELDTFFSMIPLQRNDIFRELLDRVVKSNPRRNIRGLRPGFEEASRSKRTVPLCGCRYLYMFLTSDYFIANL